MKDYQVWTKDLGNDIYPGDVKSVENWYLNILGVLSQDLVSLKNLKY